MSGYGFDFRPLLVGTLVVGVLIGISVMLLGRCAAWGEDEHKAEACRDIVGKSARYIEDRCYVASPDGSLVPARGAK